MRKDELHPIQPSHLSVPEFPVSFQVFPQVLDNKLNLLITNACANGRGERDFIINEPNPSRSSPMPPGIPGKGFEVATARRTRPDLRLADGKFGGYRSMHGTDLAAAQGAGLAAYWLGLGMDTVERASAPIAIKNHFLATKRGRRKGSVDA